MANNEGRINLSFDLNISSHKRAYELIQDNKRKKTEFVIESILAPIKYKEQKELIKEAIIELIDENKFNLPINKSLKEGGVEEIELDEEYLNIFNPE